MPFHRLRMLAWGVLMGATVPSPVAGQFSVTATAGFGTFAGGDFGGTPAGPTVGVGILYAENDSIEGGFRIDVSRYGPHGLVGRTRQIDYLASIRARATKDPVDVRAGFTVGYSTRSLALAAEPADTDGFVAGPSVTLRGPGRLGSKVELGLEALYHTYEELYLYASHEYGTDQDGFRLVARLGFVIPFAYPSP